MPSLSPNGVALNYVLEGPEGAPVIAFSNSLGTTLAMWDAQAAALRGRFRCLRYDTRGHGASAVPEIGFSVDDLASDLAGLIEGLGLGCVHVAGLSLGGMTGQVLAATRPELVDRLALVATSAYMPPADLWTSRAEMVRERGMAAIADNVIARWFTPANQASPGAAATLRDLLEHISPEGYAFCCEAIGRMDLRPRIGAIRTPTLVVSGAADPATPPAMGEEIRALVPGAALVVLPDTAHLIAVESPDALTERLAAFLES